MKKAIAIFAVLLLILPVFAYGDGYFIICDPESHVNAHLGAKKASSVVGQFYCGDELDTDGVIKNGFLHLLSSPFENGECWVYAGYVCEYDPVVMKIQTEVIGSGKVQARRYVNGKRLRWLKPGAKVTVYARADDWCVTNKGYIKTEYLGVN
jgi:hypothetical protein